MKRHLFLYTTLILLIGLVSFFAVSVFITHRNNINIAKIAVMETTKISAGLFNEWVNKNDFVNVGSDTRITIISADGTVLADSITHELSLTENHLNRPEIIAALREEPAVYIRRSNTLGVDFIYYAIKVNTENSHVFIRTALPVASIDAYLFQSLPLLIFLLLTLMLVAFLLVNTTTGRILKPFNYIEQELRLLSQGKAAPKVPQSYMEIDKIIKEIDDIATTISDEKNKLAYIINSIGDGLFVVDKNAVITLANNKACDIFNASPMVINKKLNYLVSDISLNLTIEDCINQSNNALFEWAYNGKTYLTTINQLANTPLTMIVMSDITESRRSAKQKEEFFANASHELKTPLTAIRGFNELITMHNKDENLKKFITSITRETNRMTALIGDMLKLSELENTSETEPIEVSLAKIINEVNDSISATTQEKNITIKTTGDATITAEPNHIYEIVKNLIENAVRYSNKNKTVIVTVEQINNSTQLTISDTGIGISPEEQTKIFERFYRVEKSRTKKSGGTGLGLSIVKHICAIYGWKVSLKSRLGMGTDVVIYFN